MANISLGESAINLYAAPTTNSYRITIALEELGLSYKLHSVNKQAGGDKSDWFLTISPSGSLPTLTDNRLGEEVTLTESGSILLYLTDKYDPELKLNYLFGTKEYYEVLNWLIFGVGSVASTQHEGYHFIRYAWEKVLYAELRYQTETRRLYRVINDHLANKGPNSWLAGYKFTIADIACFTWANAAAWTGLNINTFPAVKSWVARVAERETVQRGLKIPHPFFLTDEFVSDPMNRPFLEKIQEEGSLVLKHEFEDELRRQAAMNN